MSVNPFIIPLQEYDGSVRKDSRGALAPFFTPKSIGNLKQVARSLTTELIYSFIDDSECDFVVDFVQKMPIFILVRLLGIPREDAQILMPISEDIVRSVDEQRRRRPIRATRHPNRSSSQSSFVVAHALPVDGGFMAL